MAYVAPTTRADGYVVPASEWNQNAVENPIALRAGAVAIASQAANDVLYASSATQLARLAAGTSGQVLTTKGAGAAPEWGGVPLVPTAQTTTATGAQDDFDLDARYTYLRCTGAAPAFSGFTVEGSSPAAGDTVIVECLGTTAKVTAQDTGSTAANRIIAPSTNGQIVGVNGRMLLVYDGTTERWRESLIDAGAPIAVAHSAGNFTASGSMTWTVEVGDQTTFKYQQHGKTLKVWITLATTTVGGSASNTLIVAMPGGFTATSEMLNGIALIDNGVGAAGRVRVAAGTGIQHLLVTGASFGLSTNNTHVFSQIEFEVD